MTTLLRDALRLAVGTGETAALVFVPHGGQRGARQNALAAVLADAAAAEERARPYPSPRESGRTEGTPRAAAAASS